jgi:hypothetical protein
MKEMKAVMRLAIVLATLLVVSHVAFAQTQCDSIGSCDTELCYDVTITDQNGTTYHDTWFVCLQNDGTGELSSDNDGCFTLYQFGGGPGWFNTAGNPMFGGNPFWTSWIADNMYGRSGYLQPQGAGGLLLTGEGHDGSTRYTVSGKKIPCPAVN